MEPRLCGCDNSGCRAGFELVRQQKSTRDLHDDLVCNKRYKQDFRRRNIGEFSAAVKLDMTWLYVPTSYQASFRS